MFQLADLRDEVLLEPDALSVDERTLHKRLLRKLNSKYADRVIGGGKHANVASSSSSCSTLQKTFSSSSEAAAQMGGFHHSAPSVIPGAGGNPNRHVSSGGFYGWPAYGGTLSEARTAADVGAAGDGTSSSGGGLVIVVKRIVRVERGNIHVTDNKVYLGGVLFPVQFQVLLFRPEPGDYLEGVLLGCIAPGGGRPGTPAHSLLPKMRGGGLQIALGPWFDVVFVPAAELQEGSEFHKSLGRWVWHAKPALEEDDGGEEDEEMAEAEAGADVDEEGQAEAVEEEHGEEGQARQDRRQGAAVDGGDEAQTAGAESDNKAIELPYEVGTRVRVRVTEVRIRANGQESSASTRHGGGAGGTERAKEPPMVVFAACDSAGLGLLEWW